VVNQVHLLLNRISLTGSLIGGIADTQEMLDFCAKHQIWPESELIKADKIQWAWDQLNAPGGNASGKRYVIDIQASIAAG